MQTSAAETRATCEMSDVLQDGYYIAQVRRSQNAGVFVMQHSRNGNRLQIEWQDEPLPCVSIIKNRKVVNIVYV